jgi:hypothetical protein
MSDTSLAVFEFQSNSVRIVMIDGDPWFVARDLCEALNLRDTSKACARLDVDEKLIRTLVVSGQNREVVIISESGMYRLVFRSRKPEAQAFRKWVTSEVLPSIRKTGRYSLPSPSPSPLSLPEQLAAAGLPEDWPVKKYPLGVPTGEKPPLPSDRPGSLERQEIELTILLCEAFGGRLVTPEEAAIVAPELKSAIRMHFRSHGRGWSWATIVKAYTFDNCWWERFFKEPVIRYFKFNPLAPRQPQFADQKFLLETSSKN